MAAPMRNIDVQPAMKINSTDIISKFFESKKNSNCLLELEESLLSNNESTVLSSINVAQELFVQILEKNMLSEASIGDKDNDHKTYRLWLTDRYHDCQDHLLRYLQHVNVLIQETAFKALIMFVKAEGEHPIESQCWKSSQKLFGKIITALASHNIDQHHLITKLQEYSCYDDINTYSLRSITYKLQEKRMKVSDVFLNNYFNILCTIRYPKKFLAGKNSDVEFSTYLSQKGDQKAFSINEKTFKKSFSDAWIQFLKYELPVSLYRNILTVLHKKALPHLINPCLLTDFLTLSYKKGGIASLLSLNSLYFLIEKYNVDYPDFFEKLYALFNEDIIKSKFRSRFFTLSNIFLSSTHLPAQIVASFVKRLGRLALTSDPHTILIIINFICNLLIRHPMLKILIHREDPVEVSSDPYDVNEVDPAKTNALASSLWELKSLQNHINPVVSRKAKVINQDVPKVEFNISLMLEASTYKMYIKERKQKFHEVPMAIEKQSPDTLWSL